jgi:hypothetical protein
MLIAYIDMKNIAYFIHLDTSKNLSLEAVATACR